MFLRSSMPALSLWRFGVSIKESWNPSIRDYPIRYHPTLSKSILNITSQLHIRFSPLHSPQNSHHTSTDPLNPFSIRYWLALLYPPIRFAHHASMAWCDYYVVSVVDLAWSRGRNWNMGFQVIIIISIIMGKFLENKRGRPSGDPQSTRDI